MKSQHIIFLTYKIRRNPEKKYSNIVSLWLPILYMTPLYKLHKSIPATYRYSKLQNKIEHQYRKHNAFIMQK